MRAIGVKVALVTLVNNNKYHKAFYWVKGRYLSASDITLIQAAMFKDYYHFFRQNHQFLMFGLLTAFFGNYGQSFFIAWFGDSFLSSFNLTNAEYGTVYSSATLVSGFLILWAGALIDKISLKKFTYGVSGGLAIACLLLYLSEDLWQLVLALFLLRFCGQGLMFHIAFTSMARYFENNRGKAIGVVAFGMPLGEAILPALAVTLISTLGWRETWLVLGVFLLVVFWPIMNFLLNRSQDRLSLYDETVSAQPNETKAQWSRNDVIKDYRFWVLIPVVVAPAFIVTGIFIHQGILLSTKGWSEQWFALCFTIYAFSHLKSSLIIGSMVDKYSGQAMILYYLLPMLLGIVCLALPFSQSYWALAFMFLTGLTIGAAGPVVGSMWVEIYGNKNIGAIRSMVTSIMVVSTAISPILFGWLFDSDHSYQQVMNYLIGYIVVAILLMKIFVLNTRKSTEA
ncbi:MFS transporter [Aliikangiella marina]|nr:MFS transporter [Aliikangiella marina]